MREDMYVHVLDIFGKRLIESPIKCAVIVIRMQDGSVFHIEADEESIISVQSMNEEQIYLVPTERRDKIQID